MNKRRLRIDRLLGAWLGIALLTTVAFALQHWTLPLDRLRELEAESDAMLLPISDGPPENFGYVFSRLAFGSPGGRIFEGHTWDVDSPKADRQFLMGVLRYTRIHARRQEQSLRLQRSGLGAGRALGCGLFIPHKDIADLRSRTD